MSYKIDENKLKTSIRNLNTRKFGDVGEIIFSKIISNFTKSDNLSYDRKDGAKKIEIKVSRAIPRSDIITENNVYDKLMGKTSYTFVSDENKLIKEWDCNIQQIKVSCFDLLYYGLFFNEIIYLFKINARNILNDLNINYSNKQHRGNEGEGQFHINKKNIQYHIDNYLYKTLTYSELGNIIKNDRNK